MAAALGEMGAKLAITARKADERAAAAGELSSRGFEVFSTVSDLSREETSGPMLVATVAALGPIDILVNAGTGWSAPGEEHPLAGWRKVIDLNLTGTWLVTQEVARESRAPRGKPIGVSKALG